MRTQMTRLLFPKLFVAYFLLFTVYCENFPYGFPYVALVAVYCFVIHSMMFFYNHYEMPALESGAVSALEPRHWINVDVYENVQGEIDIAKDASEHVDTIWHTGGVRRRRDSGLTAPVHNTTVIEGGVATSTFVLGAAEGSDSRVMLQAPPGINLSGRGKSSGYVQNLALSRLIQYEQMASLLGEAVMESSRTSTRHRTPRAGDEHTRPRSGSTESATWSEDILSTFGVGGSPAAPGNRLRTDSVPESISSMTPSSSVDSATSTSNPSSQGKKAKKSRPNTGISDYDMTGYKPDPVETTRRRKINSIPTRKSAAEAKAKAADPVDDFGHSKAAASYNAFGVLEED